MKRSIVGALAAAALLVGCVAPQKQVPIQTQFVPKEHDKYAKEGPNMVTGQAFLRQKGGGTVTCAGARAVLFPATPFFKEMVAITAQGNAPKYEGNSSVRDYAIIARNTRCDAQGNFDFAKVPAGRYLLMSEVVWSVGNSRQGGALSREVEVVDGGQNRFLLSDEDR